MGIATMANRTRGICRDCGISFDYPEDWQPLTVEGLGLWDLLPLSSYEEYNFLPVVPERCEYCLAAQARVGGGGHDAESVRARILGYRAHCRREGLIQKREAWRRTFKRQVMARDGNKCLRCGTEKGLWVVYNRTPRWGGKPLPENLLTLCPSCKGWKGTSMLDIKLAELAPIPGEVRQEIECDCAAVEQAGDGVTHG